MSEYNTINTNTIFTKKQFIIGSKRKSIFPAHKCQQLWYCRHSVVSTTYNRELLSPHQKHSTGGWKGCGVICKWPKVSECSQVTCWRPSSGRQWNSPGNTDEGDIWNIREKHSNWILAKQHQHDVDGQPWQVNITLAYGVHRKWYHFIHTTNWNRTVLFLDVFIVRMPSL